MPIVADFIKLRGDTRVRIGDNGLTSWEETFSIPLAKTDAVAVLTFMVKGLNAQSPDEATWTEDVDVKINNQVVGAIKTYPGADVRYWYSQTILIEKNVLLAGENEIEIHAATHPDPAVGKIYDDFSLKDVILYFKEEV